MMEAAPRRSATILAFGSKRALVLLLVGLFVFPAGCAWFKKGKDQEIAAPAPESYDAADDMTQDAHLLFNRAHEAKNMDPGMVAAEDRSVLCLEITLRPDDPIWREADGDILRTATYQIAATGLFRAHSFGFGRIYIPGKCSPGI